MTPGAVSTLVSAGQHLSALSRDGGQFSVLLSTEMMTLFFSDEADQHHRLNCKTAQRIKNNLRCPETRFRIHSSSPRPYRDARFSAGIDHVIVAASRFECLGRRRRTLPSAVYVQTPLAGAD